MQPTLDLFALISLLGAAQAMLLALALVTVRRGQRVRNLLLAAFAAAVAVLVAWTTFNDAHYYLFFPHLLRVNHPFDFAIGPLFYLYVCSLTVRKPELKRSDLLHFIPVALCALYLAPYYVQSGEAKLGAQQTLSGLHWYYARVALVIPFSLVYVTLAGVRVVRYLRDAKRESAATSRPAVSQLKFLVYYFSGVWFVAVLRYALDLYDPSYMRYTNLALPFVATVFVYALALLALRRPGGLAGADEAEAEPAGRKYEKSALTPARSDAFLKRLLTVMESEKPYTDGELTLPKLAALLSISTHHLSQIINERVGQNFSDFVNTYRVEEAKRKLVDPATSHYSLLAIAEEVGFNSKSAFNTAFKKQSGMTPSEFRRATNGHSGA
jgi:AraC-like DNA-binding protein